MWFDHSVPQKCWLHLSGHAFSTEICVESTNSHRSFKRYIFRLWSTMIVWDFHGFPVFYCFLYGRLKINVAICSLHLCPRGPRGTESAGIMKMPHVQWSIWLMGILADQSGKIQLVLIMVHLCRCQRQHDLPCRRHFQEGFLTWIEDARFSLPHQFSRQRIFLKLHDLCKSFCTANAFCSCVVLACELFPSPVCLRSSSSLPVVPEDERLKVQRLWRVEEESTRG